MVDDPRPRILELLRKYGWNTTSFQVVEPGYLYWFSADGEGAVAYFDTGRWWVAAGSPICAADRLTELSEAFEQEAQSKHRLVAFFGSNRRMLQALPTWDCLLVGLEACWNPSEWSAEGQVRAQVRSQTRRAARKGIVLREAAPDELSDGSGTRVAAERLLANWLRGKHLPPLGFLARLDPFTQARERRYFLAESNGQLMGLLAAVPIYMRNGWFLEHLVIEPHSPPGTSEALVDAAMVALERDGASYASMGMVALAGAGELNYRETGHPLLQRLLQACYHSLNWLYRFQGLRSFRSKFKPQGWEPVFLVSRHPISLFTVVGVLQAFASGRLSNFALRTGQRQMQHWLSRVPTGLWWGTAAGLSGALVPWIITLLCLDSERWFGAAWMAAGWASFDVVVALLLAMLAHGLKRGMMWTRVLNRILLGTTAADAWLTTAQALLYHGAEPYTRLEGWLRMAALCAPWAAVGYLFLLQFVRRPARPV